MSVNTTLHKTCLSLFLALSVVTDGAATETWKKLEDGMELGIFQVNTESLFNHSEITVLRVNPNIWDIKLYSIKQFEYKSGISTKEWSQRHKLTAAINAGMHLPDMSTHVGYMQVGNTVQGKVVKSYQSLAAFSPQIKGALPFRIFDLDAADVSFEQIKKDYAHLVQNLRLIKRPGENRWDKKNRRWNEAALGEDKEGRALLIYSSGLLNMHDFNEALLSLPIDIVAAQHLEGGREAQLYINHPNYTKELNNSIDPLYLSSNKNLGAWPIPNIIGISKKVNTAKKQLQNDSLQ
jgi:uncharacterized protein YigE (DUF2233 family)